MSKSVLRNTQKSYAWSGSGKKAPEHLCQLLLIELRLVMLPLVKLLASLEKLDLGLSPSTGGVFEEDRRCVYRLVDSDPKFFALRSTA